MRTEHTTQCGPVQVVGVPAFADNFIWMLGVGREWVAVDPGEAAPVQAFLSACGGVLKGIWLTHHHADHTGGVADLASDWPGVRVLGPANESIAGVTVPLQGSEAFAWGGVDWRVMAVSGHTRGHVAYLGAGALFCGDVVFGLGCGRLFEGSPEDMAESLEQIAALDPATRLFCAHEYTALNLPFALAVDGQNPALVARAERIQEAMQTQLPTVPLSLAEELATNPFFRTQAPALVASARRSPAFVRRDEETSSVEVFAALRAWRNHFKAEEQ